MADERAPTRVRTAPPTAGGGPSVAVDPDRPGLLPALLEQSSDALVAMDADGHLLHVTSDVEHLLGRRPRRWRRLADVLATVHPDDRSTTRSELEAHLARRGRSTPVRLRMRHADGSWRHLEATATQRLDEPDVRAVLVAVRDVTGRIEADVAARATEARYRRLVEVSPLPTAIHQRGTLVFVNRAGLELLGADQPEQVLGRPVADFVHPDSAEGIGARIAAVLVHDEVLPPVEEVLLRVDGSALPVEVAAAPAMWDGAPAVQVVARDLSRQRRAEAELERRARHDSLTGLPNRDELVDRLRGEARWLAGGHAPGASTATERDDLERCATAVAFVGLDRFKVVNDALGHAAGDEVLAVVAQRFTAALVPGDVLGRFAGDQFVVLVHGARDAGATERRIRRLLAALEPPVVVGGRRLDVTASAGVAPVGSDTSAEVALRDASAALSAAKRSGRGQVCFADPQQRAEAAARLDIEEELRRGLELGELGPWFQPEVDLATGAVVGAEALVRWTHPSWGVMTPSAFLATAEDAGLGGRITEAVLDPACAAYAAAGSLAWISVNVTAGDLHGPDLVPRVRAALDRYGLPGTGLCLELTESSLITDPVATARALSPLRDLGVRVAIDDFGTGYSSLSYLKRFAPEFLKIDRSLVAGVAAEPSDRALVRAAIEMARALGITTVAEGIETSDQRNVLVGLGCDVGQGWLFGRPAPTIDAGPSAA